MILGVLAGGLGNQLFQIYATIAYSLENNIPFTFVNKIKTIGMTFRTTYWNTFLKSLQPYLLEEKDYNNLNFQKIKELEFKYNPLPSINNNINNNYELIGYFQSYKYFDKYSSNIHDLLKINDLKLEIDLVNKYDFNNTISMHFRIGDYKQLQHIYPILTYNYYINALKLILDYITTKNENNTNKYTNKNLHVLYFCEEKDKPDVNILINILQTEFKENLNKFNLKFECVDFKLPDWQQLLLMSNCKYNIIANSTFSWWGAYLNTNKDKLICYPKQWIYSKKPEELNGLFPPNWFRIL